MRIIICNKYYFETGGPERYMFGLIDHLERAGHEAIPFSVAATRNRPSPYAPYFVSSPVGEANYEAKLTQQKLGLRSKIRMAARAFYSGEAYSKLRALIRETHPDLVYVLNFTSYLSPSIIDAAHDEGLPVVIRLSSFDLICATHAFLRDGRICTECFHGKYHGILHRCVGGSLGASTAKVAAMMYHDARGFYKHVEAWVAPARFMKQQMVTGGFAEERVHCIPTFVDVRRFRPRPAGKPDGGYVLYFGRIAPDKGLGTLIDAQHLLGPSAPPLLLMGAAEPAEEHKLRRQCADLRLTNVHFLGPKQGNDLLEVLQTARFVVVPSVWFDNTPNVIYEAFACGLPVIATNIGSLPEQVVHEVNGLLFELNDPQDLARQMSRLLNEPELAIQLGNRGLRAVYTEYSPEKHLHLLLALFGSLVDQARHASPTGPITGRAARQ